ncbi:MAG: hypothetical protein JRG84_20305 [Deltaproteobacteria bacterium]|nr:hypothetical protein [Deltaproteobacteria bacterium]
MIELLEDPAYRHILINHLPVTGLAVAWLVLVVAVPLRHRPTFLVALALVAVMAGSAYAVIAAGEEAYPFVYDTLDGDGRAWLDHHTYLADTWAPVIYANAVLALLAIGLGSWRAKWLMGAALGVGLVTLGGFGAAAVISESGGKIKHADFRLSDPPVHERSGRSREPGRRR